LGTAVIERVGLFEALDESTFRATAHELRATCVRAGTMVFREGDPPGDLFVVRRGRVRVTTQVDGQPLVLAELGPGNFFGEMGLFEHAPRSSAVEALEDCELVCVPARFFTQLELRDPRSTARFYRLFFFEISRRLRRTNEVVAEFFRSRLAQLDRERREKEFMGLIAHDLRSPLSIAEVGMAQLLERQDKYGTLSPAQVRVLKRSRRSARFVRQLVEEMLEVGRSESGAAHLEPTTLEEVLLTAIPETLFRVDGPTLEEVDDASDWASVRACLSGQGLTVEVEDETLRAPATTDKLRVISIFMNLVGNALKYAPGAVTVRARAAGGLLRVEVVDRGPGIPESFRASIFERYRQAGAKAEGVPRGFGLGLAGARQMVESLGGTIRAEEGDGGVGTKIAFEIPWK
jgi:signal transduction histidine kinase